MRKSQEVQLATVPVRVSVFTRRHGHYGRFLGRRKPRSYHSEVLLYY